MNAHPLVTIVTLLNLWVVGLVTLRWHRAAQRNTKKRSEWSARNLKSKSCNGRQWNIRLTSCALILYTYVNLCAACVAHVTCLTMMTISMVACERMELQLELSMNAVTLSLTWKLRSSQPASQPRQMKSSSSTVGTFRPRESGVKPECKLDDSTIG